MIPKKGTHVIPMHIACDTHVIPMKNACDTKIWNCYPCETIYPCGVFITEQSIIWLNNSLYHFERTQRELCMVAQPLSGMLCAATTRKRRDDREVLNLIVAFELYSLCFTGTTLKSTSNAADYLFWYLLSEVHQLSDYFYTGQGYCIIPFTGRGYFIIFFTGKEKKIEHKLSAGLQLPKIMLVFG